MRQEWREFWHYARVKMSGILLSQGIALLFFLCELPSLPKERWLISLGISAMWGLVIYASMWLAYTLMWAWYVQKKISTGVEKHPGTFAHILAGFPALIIGTLAAYLLELKITGEPLDVSGLLTAILGGTFILFMFLFYYSYKSSKEENLKLMAANSEAKYQVLENQMKPHFLFNSLNSLSELIEENPGRAAEMAQKLSDLYRQILENSKLKTAPLSSEISIVRKYLELEKVRYGSRLNVEIDNPPNSESIYVPSLILQTLVENSIKHGISHSVEGGSVRVEAKKSGTGYEIQVSNTAGAEARESSGTGHGLANTRERLDLLYGDTHDFRLDHSHGETHARFHVSGEAMT